MRSQNATSFTPKEKPVIKFNKLNRSNPSAKNKNNKRKGNMQDKSCSLKPTVHVK